MENAHAESVFAEADANAILSLTINQRNRLSIATTIERLFDLLDTMEIDPDLEDGGDNEPWLSWPKAGLLAISDNANDDRDDEDEREPGQDDEYSLV